jgi:phosphate/sulfate permease
MEFFWSPFTVAIVAIIGGIIAGIVSTISKSRIREMEIRERIAMIERGLVPPPEADPAGFERSLQSVEGVQYRYSNVRHRNGGVIVMAVGFGLMVLIAFTSGEVNVGIGVGGFLVILGFGLFLVSLWSAPALPMPPPVNRKPPTPGNGPSGPADLH